MAQEESAWAVRASKLKSSTPEADWKVESAKLELKGAELAGENALETLVSEPFNKEPTGAELRVTKVPAEEA